VFVYAWNGFGFSGHDDAAATQSCRRMFADALAQLSPAAAGSAEP
jgi:hypothetical protein